MRQRIFYRPSPAQSLCDCLRGNTQTAGPIRQAQCLSIHRQETIAARIICLFLIGGPTTIAWRIWTIIIDTINGVIFRPWSHVTNELHRVSAPLIGHCNAAASITRVSFAVRLVAAFLDACPDLVFLCIRQAMCQIAALMTKTATTFRCASAQRQAVHVFDGATVTAASIPRAVVIRGWDFMQHNPSTESVIGTKEYQTFGHMASI